jgi:hypothetical protein
MARKGVKTLPAINPLRDDLNWRENQLTTSLQLAACCSPRKTNQTTTTQRHHVPKNKNKIKTHTQKSQKCGCVAPRRLHKPTLTRSSTITKAPPPTTLRIPALKTETPSYPRNAVHHPNQTHPKSTRPENDKTQKTFKPIMHHACQSTHRQPIRTSLVRQSAHETEESHKCMHHANLIIKLIHNIIALNSRHYTIKYLHANSLIKPRHPNFQIKFN